MKSNFPIKLKKPENAKNVIEKVGISCDFICENEDCIESIASPYNAHRGSIVFIKYNEEDKIINLAEKTEASFIVCPKIERNVAGKNLIFVNDPLGWFIRMLGIVLDNRKLEGAGAFSSGPRAPVVGDAAIGERVKIGAGSFVDDDCEIGDDCDIGVNCFLGPGTVLGPGSFVQNNVTIGSVGLGYHMDSSGERLFFPHLGGVILGEDAVVGSGSVLVRGQLTDTVIGDRVRIGNLVNIGHNVTVGDDTSISSSTVIAGGANIGSRCNIAVGVAINAKIVLEDECQVGMGSIVVRNVAAGVSVFGNPAMPVRTMKRF